MIPDLDAGQWEVVGAVMLTAFTLSLATWWGVLEWLDSRAERAPRRPAARHRPGDRGERTRPIRWPPE